MAKTHKIIIWHNQYADKIPNAQNTTASQKVKGALQKWQIMPFYEQPIKDYWITFSTSLKPIYEFKNLTMFGDDATYPGLTVENTIRRKSKFCTGRNRYDLHDYLDDKQKKFKRQ